MMLSNDAPNGDNEIKYKDDNLNHINDNNKNNDHNQHNDIEIMVMITIMIMKMVIRQ